MSVVEQLARLQTGIPGLDSVLAGGFVEGASYIIQGSPGAGKTILSNQIAFTQAATERPVLYVTLLAETHDRLFQSLSTLAFFDRKKLGGAIKYVSVFQCLRDEGLEAVVRLIREETQRQGARLLVFDGLLNARDRAETDLDVKTFVASIQSQAAFVGCTVLFLASTRTPEMNPEHTMVDGVIDLSDEMNGERTYRRLQVRKFRGSATLGGFHEFAIDSQGITVFPRLEAVLSRPSVADRPADARVPSGVAGLDALIGGGLPAGSVSVLMGPPGSGKTSLGLAFLSLATAAQPGLHFGFFETRERLSIKAAGLGLDLDTRGADGAVHFIWNPLTENILDKLAHELLHAVRAQGIRRLVIDGAGGLERAAMTPRRLVEFFAALTNELRALNVTTIMTWEMRDLLGASHAAPVPEFSAVVDNLFALRWRRLDTALQRVVSVLKVRDNHFEDSEAELRLAPAGLEVVPLAAAAPPGGKG